MVASIDICNGGLTMIGENTVALADGSKGANTFNTLYLNSILNPVLSSYPWNPLIIRAVLTQPTVPVIAGSYNSATSTVTLTLQTSAIITAASWAANSVTFTIGTHSLQVGMQITVASVSPTAYNGNYVITAVTATTIVVTLATNPGAYSSGGTITWTMPPLGIGQTLTVSGITPTDFNGTFPITAATSNSVSYVDAVTDSYVSGGFVAWAPPFEYSKYFYLPSDCIRAIRVNGYRVSSFYGFNWPEYFSMGREQIPPFKIENGFLLTNETAVSLKYVQLQNPPQDPVLVDLLTKKCAAVMAYPMTRNESLKTNKEKEFEMAYLRAKNIFTNQGTPDEEQEDEWISARR